MEILPALLVASWIMGLGLIFLGLALGALRNSGKFFETGWKKWGFFGAFKYGDKESLFLVVAGIVLFIVSMLLVKWLYPLGF